MDASAVLGITSSTGSLSPSCLSCHNGRDAAALETAHQTKEDIFDRYLLPTDYDVPVYVSRLPAYPRSCPITQLRIFQEILRYKTDKDIVALFQDGAKLKNLGKEIGQKYGRHTTIALTSLIASGITNKETLFKYAEKLDRLNFLLREHLRYFSPKIQSNPQELVRKIHSWLWATKQGLDAKSVHVSNGGYHTFSLLYYKSGFDRWENVRLDGGNTHETKTFTNISNFAQLGSEMYNHLAIDAGDPKLKLHYYNQGLALNPASSLIHTNRGKLYYDQGKHKKAAADLWQSVKLDPYDPGAHYFRGLNHLKTNQPLKAAEDFGQAIKHQPKHLEAHLELGKVYFRLGKYSQSITNLNIYLKLCAEKDKGNEKDKEKRGTPNKDAHYYLGLSYLRQRQYKKGLEALHKVVGSPYDHPEKSIIKWHAIKMLDAVIAADNNRTAAYFCRAIIAAEEHETSYIPPQAFNDIDEVIRRKPIWAEAYFERGKISQQKSRMYRGEDKAKAIADFKMAAKLKPKWADPHFEMAKVLSDFGLSKDKGEAVRELQETVGRAPNHCEANLALGIIALNKKDYCQSTTYLSAAKHCDRYQDHNVHLYRGFAYLKLWEPRRAAEDLSQAISTEPNSTARFLRGLAYLGDSKYQLAIDNFEKAVPDDYFSYHDLYYLDPKVFDSDYSLSTESYETNKKFNLALAYLGLGQQDKARKLFNQIFNDPVFKDRLLFFSGLSSLKSQQPDKAIRAFNEALSLDQFGDMNEKIRTARGIVYFLQGKTDQAVADLEKAIAVQSWNGIAHYYLGLAYLRQHQWKKAFYNGALGLLFYEPTKQLHYYGVKFPPLN